MIIFLKKCSAPLTKSLFFNYVAYKWFLRRKSVQKLRSVKKIQLGTCTHLISRKKNRICCDWWSNCTCLLRQRVHNAGANWKSSFLFTITVAWSRLSVSGDDWKEARDKRRAGSGGERGGDAYRLSRRALFPYQTPLDARPALLSDRPHWPRAWHRVRLLRPTIQTNPSGKRSFSKTFVKPEEFEYVRFALNVASKTYWKQTFSNTWLPCSYVSHVISLGCPSFPLKRVSKMNAKFCVFIFLQRSVATGQKQGSCQSSWTTLTIIL